MTKPFPQGWTKVYEDRLLITYRKKWGSQVVHMRKRVTTNCQLTDFERIAYAQQGTIHCVKLIRERLKCSLHDAWVIMQEERGFKAGTPNPWEVRHVGMKAHTPGFTRAHN